MKGKKRNILLMACLISGIILMGASCKADKPTDVKPMALDEKEAKMAEMLSDNFGRFQLQVGKFYKIRVYSYGNGEMKNVGTIDQIAPSEDNQVVNIVGTNQQGCSTRWAVYMDTKQLDVTVDNRGVLGDGGYSYKSSMLLEQAGTRLAPDEERALMLMVYRKVIRADSATPTLPLGQGDAMLDQLKVLSKENDLVYLVTIALEKTPELPLAQ